MVINYLLITLFLIAALLVYFKIAVRYHIVDVPNHRSSHQEITIRGAGVIFPLSVLICYIVFGQISPVLIVGLLLISVISFTDDLLTLKAGLRFGVQLFAVTCLLYAMQVFGLWPLWLIVLSYIIITGTINAFNFMDGINGITGIYSLIALLALLYVNNFIIYFQHNSLFVVPAIACIIFLFFNFRLRAKCFAGDVGSISIAFWLVALTISVINQTHTYKYLFFFSIYGADAVLTIFKRITLQQNLLQAHRLHAYQLLVNNGKFSHRRISLFYGLAQLIINLLVLFTDLHFGFYFIIIIGILSLTYLNIEKRYGYKLSG